MEHPLAECPGTAPVIGEWRASADGEGPSKEGAELIHFFKSAGGSPVAQAKAVSCIGLRRRLARAVARGAPVDQGMGLDADGSQPCPGDEDRVMGA